VLTNIGPVLLAGGGADVVEVIDAANAAGVGYNLLSVNGDIGLRAAGANPFQIKLVSFNGSGTAGAVTNFNNNTNYTWTIASTTGSVTNFDPSVFNVDNSSFSNDLAGGQFVLQSGSLNVVFTNNHPPLASDATYARAKGVSLKIKISDLAANWSDPDGDGTEMIGIDATSTNGASITTNATEIFYTVVTAPVIQSARLWAGCLLPSPTASGWSRMLYLGQPRRR
jgi:hypothetical protein